MASKTMMWVGGTVLVALVIGAGAWFGVIEPTFADAAEQREAAADQRERNDLLELQNLQLKADYARLDEYRATLAELQTKVPTIGDLAELTRQLQAQADATGVTITAVSPGIATAFIPPAAVTDPAATGPTSTDDAATSDETGSTDDADSTSSDTADAPAEPTVIDGLYTISLSVTTVGTYDQTLAFLDAVQQTMARLYVVDQVNAVSLEAAGAASGLPAVADGDLQTMISGFVLTLVNADASSSDDGSESPPGDEEPALPVPSDQRNPFAPIAS